MIVADDVKRIELDAADMPDIRQYAGVSLKPASRPDALMRQQKAARLLFRKGHDVSIARRSMPRCGKEIQTLKYRSSNETPTKKLNKNGAPLCNCQAKMRKFWQKIAFPQKNLYKIFAKNYHDFSLRNSHVPQ